MKIERLRKLIVQLAKHKDSLRLPHEITDDRWRDTGILDSEGRMIQVSVATDNEFTIRSKRPPEYRSVPLPGHFARKKKATAKKAAPKVKRERAKKAYLGKRYTRKRAVKKKARAKKAAK